MTLLNIHSIAVIGASASPHKVGHMIFRNLLTQGFQGEVYAVNTKGEEILGKKSFKTIGEIPGALDMAIIVTPAPTVPGVVEECMSKEVKTVVVISAGFSETHTEEGKQLEQQIIEAAKSQIINRKSEIRLIGPNCLGILIPRMGLNASFAKDLPKPGPIALISQSGALAVALIDQSLSLGIGYSQIFSIGNKTVMDECDFLEECAADSKTKVIGLYLENIKDGRRFLKTAAQISKEKPIVLLKSGISDAGRKAASSHTGALAGSSAAIDAACAQTGIHRADHAEEFLMLLQTLSLQPQLRTNRIAVITNAGGPGILATDATEAAGLTLPSLQPATCNSLAKKLPSSASVSNPIDVLGDALCDRYSAALDATGDDAGIDGIIVLLTPQMMTPVAEVATAIVDFHKRLPLMPVVACFMGGPSMTEGQKVLMQGSIPYFPTPEAAVHAMATLLPSKKGNGVTEKRGARTRKEHAQKILAKHSGLLDEDTSKELFSLYQLPQPEAKIAKTADEAVAIAKNIGFPVIAKISSPQILHKTDVGGVKGIMLTRFAALMKASILQPATCNPSLTLRESLQL
jgi:acetyltransferase